MPQSAEHIDACLALGVRDGLLVITRCDLLDPEPALADVRGAAGRHRAGRAPGGRRLRGHRARAWTGCAPRWPRSPPGCPPPIRRPTCGSGWTGRSPSAAPAPWSPAPSAPARSGSATSWSCSVRRAPRRVAVRGLQSLGAPVPAARGVARVAVNLRGLPRDAVGPRATCCAPPRPGRSTDTLDVRLHGTRHPAPPADGAARAAAAARRGGRGAGPGAAARPGHRPAAAGPTAAAAHRGPGGAARPGPARGGRRGDRARRRAAGRCAAAAPPPAAPPSWPAWARSRTRPRSWPGAGWPGGPSWSRWACRRPISTRWLAAGAPAAGGWLVDPGRAGSLVERLRAAVAAHDAADPLDPGLPVEAARRAGGTARPAAGRGAAAARTRARRAAARRDG